MIMGETTPVKPQQRSLMELVTSNLIQIVAIIVILVSSLGVIIPKTPWGPFPGASFLTSIVSLGFPFGILCTVLLTLHVNYVRLTKAKDFNTRFGAVVFFLLFIPMFIAQLTLGATHPFFVAEYDLVYIHGTAAVECLCGVAIMMMLIRDIRPRSIAQGYVILVVMLGIMVVSPVGDFLPTTVLDVANWVAIYPSGVGGSILTFGLYMGLLGLVIRVFTFKEKLRVGAD
jgi:hypothetical protein